METVESKTNFMYQSVTCLVQVILHAVQQPCLLTEHNLVRNGHTRSTRDCMNETANKFDKTMLTNEEIDRVCSMARAGTGCAGGYCIGPCRLCHDNPIVSRHLWSDAQL